MISQRTFRKQQIVLISISVTVLILVIHSYSQNYESGHYRRCSIIPQYITKELKNSKIPRLVPGNGLKMDERWQPVTSSEDTFVYSAFYEENFSDRVRIVGATTTTERRDLYCILWYDGLTTTYSLVKANVVYINEGNTKRFTAVHFVCQMCGQTVPDVVSLVDEAHLQRPLNTVRVRILTTTLQLNMSVCIPPIFSSTEEAHIEHLLEWIEFNQVLGVQMFTFYVNNASQRYTDVLNYYKSQGKVELMNWVLGEDSKMTSNELYAKDIHNNGQLVALNDCLYRNKGRSRYTMAIGLDEFIVPRDKAHITLGDMIKHLPDKSSYIFKHSYFKKHCDENTKLCLVNNYERETEVRLDTDRSKMIFKPNKHVALGIQNFLALVSPAEGYVVNSNDGSLHRYRSKPAGEIQKYINDRATEKYHQIVLDRMNQTMSHLLNHNITTM